MLYIRHAGKSGRARGSSQFEAEGDIILTLKRPEGNQKENVRVLEGIGRYDDIPRKLNVELTEEGYVALGSNGQVQFGKAVEVIKLRLPQTSESAISQDELFEEIREEDVSKKTMQRALKWLVEQKTVHEEGEGVKGDPYRYWMPPVPTPPTIIPAKFLPLMTRMEKGAMVRHPYPVSSKRRASRRRGTPRAASSPTPITSSSTSSLPSSAARASRSI